MRLTPTSGRDALVLYFSPRFTKGEIQLYLLQPAYESSREIPVEAPDSLLSSSPFPTEAHLMLVRNKSASGCLHATEAVTSPTPTETTSSIDVTSTETPLSMDSGEGELEVMIWPSQKRVVTKMFCGGCSGSGCSCKVTKCKLYEFNCAMKKMGKRSGVFPDCEPSEVKHLASLFHPNIVQLFAAWRDNPQTLCICTELVERNLSAYLDSIQDWDSDCANKIFQEIVIALCYVHEEGLVHQDIKPENIALNDPKDIKLIDFGSAAAVAPDGMLVIEFSTGSKLYCAPEQRAFNAYNQKVDIFSLGLIYYQLFLSKPPPDVPNSVRMLSLKFKLEKEPDWRDKAYIMKSWSSNEFSKGWSGDLSLWLDMIAPFAQKRLSSKEIFDRINTQDDPILRMDIAHIKSAGKKAFVEKNYLKAVKLYTKATEDYPNDRTLYSNMSICWLRMGDGYKALKDAQTCREKCPDWPKACYLQGAAHMLLKEYGKACDAFREALRLDPSSVETEEALGEAMNCLETSRAGES